MTMRTYDRETYLRLRDAWRTFGPEWTAARELCALRGYPFPPNGTALDDRDDPEPSQRAIVWRALEYRPLRTLDVIRTARSWSEVVRRIMAEEDRLREDIGFGERDAAWEKDGQPNHHQSTRLLGDILAQMRDSLP